MVDALIAVGLGLGMLWFARWCRAGAGEVDVTIRRREELWAENAPDCYGGESCDQLVPDWRGQIPKHGPESVGQVLEMDARHFAPGTRVYIAVPECPTCGESAAVALDAERGVMGRCLCGFDWPKWARETFG